MNLELDAPELVSRYAAIVDCYHHFARTWKDWAAIVSRIQEVSQEAENRGISIDSIRPMLEIELSERFDPATAHRLSLEFLDLITVLSASTPAMAGQEGIYSDRSIAGEFASSA